MHWVMHVLGLDDASGAWYLFWSGFGGHVPVAASIALLLWRRWTCATPRCHRLAHINRSDRHFCHRHADEEVRDGSAG